MTTTTPTSPRPDVAARSSSSTRASSVGVLVVLGLAGVAVALVGSSTVSLWTD